MITRARISSRLALKARTNVGNAIPRRYFALRPGVKVRLAQLERRERRMIARGEARAVTTEAIKAVRRGETVKVGPVSELLASLNAGD